VTLGRVQSPGLKIFRSQLIGTDCSRRSPPQSKGYERPVVTHGGHSWARRFARDHGRWGADGLRSHGPEGIGGYGENGVGETILRSFCWASAAGWLGKARPRPHLFGSVAFDSGFNMRQRDVIAFSR
jgi:hypothetical protein